ncbi:DUF4399 domain-containing protein [Rhodoferax sp.]|uniref:DUF4399 domain-containing protein n=1 Tax=Rhodoferax sp. TaxID=50421 RepID=UPI00374D959A
MRMQAEAARACVGWACLVLCSAGGALAQAAEAVPAAPIAVASAPVSSGPVAAKADDGAAHAWVFPPPQRSPEAYFTNLASGASVQSPFVVRFGLSMRGLVPAGNTAGQAGHHHLLINQPLPLDFTKALPFTEKYIHFGKGQMESVLNLPPGDYTLRLVLADQGHIPFFVYSKPLLLKVTQQNKDVAPATVQGPPRAEIMGLSAGEVVKPPFRLQFHASGFNIAHAAAKLPDTHYFRLVLERPGAKPEVLNFRAGQTEVWLNPPKGAYSAHVELVRNVTTPEVVAARSPALAFEVGS